MEHPSKIHCAGGGREHADMEKLYMITEPLRKIEQYTPSVNWNNNVDEGNNRKQDDSYMAFQELLGGEGGGV